jgi:murein DD-endopeptidase MepM/ murein hydrolase activator NlpD
MSHPWKILSIISVIFVASCNYPENPEKEIKTSPPDTAAAIPAKSPVFMYGIPSDSFYLVSGHVKPNEFLSDILLKHGVTNPEIDQAIKNSKSVFDVRTVRSGSDYVLFCDKDSVGKAKYLVYDQDPTTCFVFSFNDSLNITRFSKKMTSEIRYASGTIETSLWDAMKAGGLRPNLAVELSNIFAWTVDFFGLQKGDNFKVIYEELFIDGKSLGPGKVYVAQFNRAGSSITAIPFVQDGKETFFDTEGNSLRKAFLKAPLEFSRITSRFSSSRMHPILRIRRPHYGVDYAAPIGTSVHAVGDGKITSMTIDSGAGRMVRIQHNSVYATSYMHLSRFGPGIYAGSRVSQNQIIGFVGSSGLSTGPHLDFRFYMNGSPVDPLRVNAPPAEPITEANRPRFEMIKSVDLSLLGSFN